MPQNNTVKPIPNGCSKYRFNAMGTWATSTISQPESELISGHRCVFECIASNPGVALEKYRKATELAYDAAKQVLRIMATHHLSSPKQVV